MTKIIFNKNTSYPQTPFLLTLIWFWAHADELSWLLLSGNAERMKGNGQWFASFLQGLMSLQHLLVANHRTQMCRVTVYSESYALGVI